MIEPLSKKARRQVRQKAAARERSRRKHTRRRRAEAMRHGPQTLEGKSRAVGSQPAPLGMRGAVGARRGELLKSSVHVESVVFVAWNRARRPYRQKGGSDGKRILG